MVNIPPRRARGLRFAPLLACSLALLVARAAAGQDDQHEMLFWLSADYIKDLAAKRTIHYPMQMNFDEHSGVHTLSSDCELHVAWLDGGGHGSPAAVVAEPPNVCHERLPGAPKTGSIGVPWIALFDNLTQSHQKCTVVGFPRIFAEHAAGEGTGGSNADHVLEIHPALSISCDNGVTLDLSKQLKVFPGMRKITDASASACLEQRKLWVRKHDDRYEFAEEGAKGSGGRCGNFVVLDAIFHKGAEYVREFDKNEAGHGDHSAIAWVTVGDLGPYSLKIYTYRDTPEDAELAQVMAGTRDPSDPMHLHGLLTYDYFTIIRSLQDKDRNWLESIDDWKEVPHPLALVVFGTAQ